MVQGQELGEILGVNSFFVRLGCHMRWIGKDKPLNTKNIRIKKIKTGNFFKNLPKMFLGLLLYNTPFVFSKKKI